LRFPIFSIFHFPSIAQSHILTKGTIMSDSRSTRTAVRIPRFRLRAARLFTPVTIFLLIEFLDEFVSGIPEASWPLMRAELALTYAQIGLLHTIPDLISIVLEPIIGILGDVWRRRVLMLLGAAGVAVALLLIALAQSFWALMFAFIVIYPSSGAFVSLSQAALMDSDPKRHEQNMARWGFAGSIGVVVGALTINGALSLGLSWRSPYLIGVAMTIFLALALMRIAMPRNTHHAEDGESPGFVAGLRGAVRALRRGAVWRWLILLEFADLMMDILHGFLALYFVDVVRTTPEEGALAVMVWTGVGLVGDFLIIPVLEKVRGLEYLRVSAAIELVLFAALMLVPGLIPKLIILALLGFFNAGWYPVLQGQLYSAMPGQSGTVLTVQSVTGLGGSLIPIILGGLAEQFGLGAALWLCILGPIALLIGIPRRR
jgi:MFS transporter, FSR family, fosmidomycin resistance protein